MKDKGMFISFPSNEKTEVEITRNLTTLEKEFVKRLEKEYPICYVGKYKRKLYKRKINKITVIWFTKYYRKESEVK